MLPFIQFPVTIKENDCTDNKQRRYFKKPSQMPPFVFDVQHWNT